MIRSLAVTAMLLATATAHAEVKRGDHFVDISAHTATGKQFRLKDMAGKWVVFSFNASWCEPCRKELPALDKIAPQLAGKVLFISINIDTNEADGKEFMQSLKLHHVFPVFQPDENCPAMRSYDPDRMPSTFVMDPKGTIQLVEFGYNKGDEDKLRTKLVELTK